MTLSDKDGPRYRASRDWLLWLGACLLCAWVGYVVGVHEMTEACSRIRSIAVESLKLAARCVGAVDEFVGGG